MFPTVLLLLLLEDRQAKADLSIDYTLTVVVRPSCDCHHHRRILSCCSNSTSCCCCCWKMPLENAKERRQEKVNAFAFILLGSTVIFSLSLLLTLSYFSSIVGISISHLRANGR